MDSHRSGTDRASSGCTAVLQTADRNHSHPLPAGALGQAGSQGSEQRDNSRQLLMKCLERGTAVLSPAPDCLSRMTAAQSRGIRVLLQPGPKRSM
jgi:hypothetical protein